MNLILIILLSFFNISDDIEIVRNLYLAAHYSEHNCNDLGEKLASMDNKKSILIQGYHGCYYFIKCKFIKNPVDKLNSFKKGKQMLENAINQNPQSIELRFLRYTIQKKLPSILFYYNSKYKDLSFIEKNLKNLDDKKTKDFISTSLNSINK